MEKQIKAAELRLESAVHSETIHEKNLEQHEELFEFFKDKFTNLGLYTWLAAELQRMFKGAYRRAIVLARMAERAYRFERNDDTTILLNGNYRTVQQRECHTHTIGKQTQERCEDHP